MGKGNGSFLLSDGDILKLSPSVHLLYRRDRHREEDHFDVLQTVEMRVGFSFLLQAEHKLIACRCSRISTRLHSGN